MEASQLPQLVCSWVSQGKVYFKISFSICQIRKPMMVQVETIIVTSQLPWLHINCWNQLQVFLHLKSLHVFLQAFQKVFSFFSFHSAGFLVMSFVTDIVTVSLIMTLLGNFFSLEYILPVSFCLNDYPWLSNILILCYYVSNILIRLSCNSVKIQNRALFLRY